MPLSKGNSKSVISKNIREFHTGKTYAHTASKFGKKKADAQAIAVALNTARKYARKADGGPADDDVGYDPAAMEGRPRVTIPLGDDRRPIGNEDRPPIPLVGNVPSPLNYNPDYGNLSASLMRKSPMEGAFPPGPYMSAVHETPRDIIRNIIAGPDTKATAPRAVLADKLMNVLDFTPPMMAEQAGEDIAKGNLQEAGMFALPGAKKAKTAEAALLKGAEAAGAGKLGNFFHPYDLDPDLVKKAKPAGGQAGSNAGGLYHMPDGSPVYIKPADGPNGIERVYNEKLANELLKLAGVPVADVRMTKFKGKPAIASHVVPGQELNNFPSSQFSNMHDLAMHYPAQLWVGNYDFVGNGMDNIIYNPATQEITHIDPGGALRFRAQGALKGPDMWGPEVKHFDLSKNPNLADVMNNVDPLVENIGMPLSASKVANISDEAIDSLVNKYGPLKKGEKAKLADTLKQRRDQIADMYGVKPESGGSAPPAGNVIPFKQPSVDDLHKKISGKPMSLTSGQEGSVNYWTQPHGYKEINNALRGKSALEPEVASHVKNLDDAISKSSPLDSPTSVWRGVHGPQAEVLKGLKEGDVFHNAGYSSTTIDKNRATHYGVKGDEEGVIIQYDLPKKYPSLYTSHPDAGGWSENERELLLPRDAKFKIVKKEKIQTPVYDYSGKMKEEIPQSATVYHVTPVEAGESTALDVPKTDPFKQEPLGTNPYHKGSIISGLSNAQIAELSKNQAKGLIQKHGSNGFDIAPDIWSLANNISPEYANQVMKEIRNLTAETNPEIYAEMDQQLGSMAQHHGYSPWLAEKPSGKVKPDDPHEFAMDDDFEPPPHLGPEGFKSYDYLDNLEIGKDNWHQSITHDDLKSAAPGIDLTKYGLEGNSIHPGSYSSGIGKHGFTELIRAGKVIRPIKDWVNWVPPVSNRPIVVPPTSKSFSEIKKLGFNPNFNIYKGGVDELPHELPNPLEKDFEKAFYAADNPDVASQYGAFKSTHFARALNPIELYWPHIFGFTSKTAPESGAPFSGSLFHELIDAARKEGKDLIVMHGVRDLGPGNHTQYMFLDTRGTLRSIDAKFNADDLHTFSLNARKPLAGIIGGAPFVYGAVRKAGGDEEKDKMATGGKVKKKYKPPHWPVRIKGYHPPKKRIDTVRHTVKQFADGGGVDDPEFNEDDFINFQRGGMIKSNIPGRTDKIPMKVPTGSYVLPADVVSHLGENNTHSSEDVLGALFPNSHSRAERNHAEHELTPIVAAGGEHIIHPEDVAEIGNGSLTAGHKVLDKFVLHTRKEHIKALKKMKPPK